MKLLSLALLRWHHDSSVGPEPVILDAAYNLSDFGFFQRGGCGTAAGARARAGRWAWQGQSGNGADAGPRRRGVPSPTRRHRMKEMLTFVSRTVIKRTRLGGRQVVKHEGPLTPAAAAATAAPPFLTARPSTRIPLLRPPASRRPGRAHRRRWRVPGPRCLRQRPGPHGPL